MSARSRVAIASRAFGIVDHQSLLAAYRFEQKSFDFPERHRIGFRRAIGEHRQVFRTRRRREHRGARELRKRRLDRREDVVELFAQIDLLPRLRADVVEQLQPRQHFLHAARLQLALLRLYSIGIERGARSGRIHARHGQRGERWQFTRCDAEHGLDLAELQFVAIFDRHGLRQFLAAIKRAVGAVLIAQFVDVTVAADQRVAARYGGIVEADFRKLPAADHGHIGKTENLSGQYTGSDDQTRHDCEVAPENAFDMIPNVHRTRVGPKTLTTDAEIRMQIPGKKKPDEVHPARLRCDARGGSVAAHGQSRRRGRGCLLDVLTWQKPPS